MEHVRVLAAEIGPRPAGSEGEARTAAYLQSVLSGLGYEVSLQPVRRPDGGVSSNLVARSPGADYSGGYLLVGGHYDTYGAIPGANDNASGTAVVLALATALAGTAAPVEFAAFAAEERRPGSRRHHLGSEAYVAALPEAAPVQAMLSIDMVGVGSPLLVGCYRTAPADLREEVARAARGVGVPVRTIVRGDVSDHVPFARRGIPSAWLWSGEHPSFHKPMDTLEVVQPEALDRAGRAALAWLEQRVPKLASRGSIPSQSLCNGSSIGTGIGLAIARSVVELDGPREREVVFHVFGE
ncbi:MAG: M28 family metallopeptidase [Actinomycetota bacterium]